MSSESLAGYFREAANWDADRLQQTQRTARRAWRVAGAGWSCALAVALALVLLMPLKRVEPFLVRVDSSTGIVDIVPVYTGKAGLEQSVTRYFLSHYATRPGTRCGIRTTPPHRSMFTRTAALSACRLKP